MKKPPKYAFIKRFALSLPGASEQRDRLGIWFNIGRKTFALYSEREQRWILKLPKPQLQMLLDARPETFSPMRAGLLFWGFVRVEDLSAAELRDYITAAWRTIAPKKLQKEYLDTEERT